MAGSPKLDLSTVLGAAFGIVDADGLDALTMRKLGSDLGVEAMAVYRYARSKEALLDEMVGQMMSRLTIDATASDWRAELHRLAASYRASALEHPAMMPLLAARPLDVSLSRRPSSVLEVTEAIFELLHRAQLRPDEIVTIYRRFVSWVVGRVLEELRVLVDSPDEPDPVDRLGLYRLPTSRYPRLRELAPIIGQHDPDRDLHEGLDLVLALPPHPLPERRGR